MGFGGELSLFVLLGFVILGPKRMQTLLHHVARLKGELQQAKESLQAEVRSGIDNGEQRVSAESSPPAV